MPFRAEMFAIYVEYNIAPIPIWARNILHAFFAIQQIWKYQFILISHWV